MAWQYAQLRIWVRVVPERISDNSSSDSMFVFNLTILSGTTSVSVRVSTYTFGNLAAGQLAARRVSLPPIWIQVWRLSKHLQYAK